MNTIQFPPDFIWGTSTAAAQIETATEHNWRGVKSLDGHIFERTADHELYRNEDVQYIAQLGNAYRMSLDWSRLQTQPMQPFDPQVVAEYRSFMAKLTARNVRIMLVLHHFCEPLWFVRAGGWQLGQNIQFFIQYVEQIIQHFGDMVSYWNTFNEPNVYAVNAYLLGNFPPHQKNWLSFRRVVNNLSRAHRLAVALLHRAFPDKPVGVSNNCVIFAPDNLLGWLPAKVADYVFMTEIPDAFIEGVDFFGMSYYARIGFNPMPISELGSPGKLAQLGKPHDKMWEYYPDGLLQCLQRYWKKYQKPIIITENGICTDDCQLRINSLRDYLSGIYQALQQGIPVQGYFHWATMDNFEWHLGPTYKFGLVSVNYATGERHMKQSGEYYARIVQTGRVEL